MSKFKDNPEVVKFTNWLITELFHDKDNVNGFKYIDVVNIINNVLQKESKGFEPHPISNSMIDCMFEIAEYNQVSEEERESFDKFYNKIKDKYQPKIKE